MPFSAKEVALFWIATALCATILVLCALLSAKLRSISGRYGTAILLFILVASIPFWGSLLFLVLGSFAAKSSGFWSVAPWLTIIFTVRYLVWSAGITAIGAAIYLATPVPHSRKLAFSLAAMLLLLGGAAWSISSRMMQAAEALKISRAEAAMVTAFVMQAPQLPDVVALPAKATVIKHLHKKGLPYRYAVQVISQAPDRKSTIVIVDADREQGQPKWMWACTTRDTFGWERLDPCSKLDSPSVRD